MTTAADTYPDWLSLLTAAPLEQLFVWQPPRLTSQALPPQRTDPALAHAKRYMRVLSDRRSGHPRWIQLPDRPSDRLLCAAGEPAEQDYASITRVLRRRPCEWAVIYVGDRTGASAVRYTITNRCSGQARGGTFDAIMRAAGDGLFQTHARFFPHPH